MTNEDFKNTRLKLGLTQKEFAKLLGVGTDRTIRQYEKGKYKIPPYITKQINYINETEKK